MFLSEPKYFSGSKYSLNLTHSHGERERGVGLQLSFKRNLPQRMSLRVSNYVKFRNVLGNPNMWLVNSESRDWNAVFWLVPIPTHLIIPPMLWKLIRCKLVFSILDKIDWLEAHSLQQATSLNSGEKLCIGLLILSLRRIKTSRYINDFCWWWKIFEEL